MPQNEHIEGEDMQFKYGDGSIKKCYRTNKDGTRRYFWRGRIYINRKQYSVYARTQAECAGKLKVLRSERKESFSEDSQTPLIETFNQNKTFNEWLSLWIELCKEGKIKRTYRRELISHVETIKAALGHFRLRDLKPLNILTYIHSLPQRNLTVKLYDIINGSLQKAEDFGIIKRNPCKAIDRPTHRTAEKRSFELHEQTEILAALEGKHKRAFFFLCATGLRIGEFLALDKNCIDFKNGCINVSASMNIKSGETVSPKTKNSVRQIYFAPKLFDIFNIEELGTFTYSGIKKAFLKAYKKLGLTGISLTHSCRHTYASMMCAAGIPVKIVQMQLGHAAFSTTMDIYTSVLMNGSSPIYDYIIELKDEIKKRLL